MRIQSKGVSAISPIHQFFLFLLTFCFLLSPRLNLKIDVHAGFFSVALLAVLVFVRQRTLSSFPKPLVLVAVFFMFFAIYNLVIATLYDNNATYFISICISAIISIVFGWLLASHLLNIGSGADDLLDHLFMLCTIAAIVNSIIILIEFTFPEIRSIIESYLLQNSEGLIYAEHPFQLRGLASAGGAGLSVFNATVILLIIYLFIKNRISVGFALLVSIVITCSNIFTGRTGLILSILFTSILLIIILIENMKSGLSGLVRAVSVTVFSLLLLNYFSNYDLTPEISGWAFEWVDSILTGKIQSASSDDLKTMLFLPGDPIHLLFGIGFFEGVGKIYPRSDSGYIKTILSIGLPLSVLFYSAIAFMFFQICRVAERYFWLVLSILGVMLFIEIKEPFFYQNFNARMIFLLSGAAMFILTKNRTFIRTNANHAN